MKKIFKMILGVLATFIGVIVLIGVIFVNTSSQFGSKPTGEDLTRISLSENYKTEAFNNLTETPLDGKIEFWKTLKEYFSDGDKVPDWSLPVHKISVAEISALPDTLTKVTWFGHSALLLEMDGKKIFIDPMLSAVPAPHPWLGSKRFNDTLPLAIEDIPQLDAVIISHDHYDHLDYESIKKLKDKVGHFYVPLGVG